MNAFVAVLLGPPDEGLRAGLAAAGAVDVLAWEELEDLSFGDPDDDLPAVLLEAAQDPADLRRVLDMLEADIGPLGHLRGPADTAVATTRPVTDTLKLVAGDGRLTGTADRERHRFVDLPIAVPLGLLRAAAGRVAESVVGLEEQMPPVGAVEVLAALVSAGAVVLSCPSAAGAARPGPGRPGT